MEKIFEKLKKVLERTKEKCGELDSTDLRTSRMSHIVADLKTWLELDETDEGLAKLHSLTSNLYNKYLSLPKGTSQTFEDLLDLISKKQAEVKSQVKTTLRKNLIKPENT